jgi:hypothetical protein
VHDTLLLASPPAIDRELLTEYAPPQYAAHVERSRALWSLGL